MPFADERRFVAGVVQEPRPGDQRMAFATTIDIVNDAVRVRIKAGQKAAPTRRAKRRRSERIAEHRPFLRQAINIRRLDERMADAAQLIEPQIVHQDEDDIWTGRIGSDGADYGK